MLCLTLSPFHFFKHKILSKKITNLIINITQIVYLIAIFWLKTKSFNVKLFLDIANENKK